MESAADGHYYELSDGGEFGRKNVYGDECSRGELVQKSGSSICQHRGKNCENKNELRFLIVVYGEICVRYKRYPLYNVHRFMKAIR